MTRLRLFLSLLCSAALFSVFAPGAALADSPSPGIPLCSPTANLLNGLGNGLGLGNVGLGGGGGISVGGSGGPGTIGFSQSGYDANEDAGQFWLTITRSNTSGLETVGYGVKQNSAQSPEDFINVPNAEAVFVPGQASCQFPVTITDNGMNGPSVAALAYLFNSSAATIDAANDNINLTILRNDPLSARSLTNPLDLPVAPTDGDPLTGAQFYVAPDANTGAGQASLDDFRTGNAADARALKFIASQPTGYRFWMYRMPADPAPEVARWLETAQQQEPGRVIELSTYSVVHAPCTSTANPAFTQRYLNWIRGLAQGIGNTRVVMYFEIDSLITSPCLSNAQRHIRFAEQLKPAIQILEAADPHLVLYLDAGASDALSAANAARDLRQAGVYDAQGFFLNATHFQWDTTEIKYGQQISRMLGGHVHFLIASTVNGRGPLLNKHPRTQGVEQLCNPVGRGLGTMSTQTGYTNLDGLLWFAPAGNSGGACRAGAPPTAVFWPAYAVALYRNRAFGITGPRFRLQHSGTYVPYSAAFTR